MIDRESVPQAEVDEWIDAVRRMHYGELSDPDCWEPAARAAVNLMSGCGVIDAPRDVLKMIRQAIETGYAKALEDVRDGRFDGQIQMWRPDLTPDSR